jgi:hypothetical protein
VVVHGQQVVEVTAAATTTVSVSMDAGLLDGG